MSQDTIVEIDGVGAVSLEKSRRARRLNISLGTQGRIRVAVPWHVSIDKAVELVSRNVKWVRKFLSKVEKARRAHHTVSQGLTGAGREKAGTILADRVSRLAAEYGFSYNRLTVRIQKTRWGSCSSKNNININAKLAELPEKIMDYVLLHELVHTRVKNHGKDFWKELERFLPEARDIDRELKKYQLTLM
ncbi:MAG: M48 family metallopeptidase [Candidatus Omnitrophota bacterium]